MKEQLRAVIRGADPSPPGVAVNLVREYLQARILLALQDAGAMIPLAFQGGTALRFLFGLPRFSEDLGFALERPGRSGFDLVGVGQRVTAQLKREGYQVVTKPKTGLMVSSFMVAFPRVLYELGLSPHPSQRLRIRIELDTKPPSGRVWRPRSCAGTSSSTCSTMTAPLSLPGSSTRFCSATG